FIVNHLGGEAYGAWALFGSLVGYMGLVDLGVRGAVTRFVARLHAAGHHAEAGRITTAGLLFFGVASGIAVRVGSGLRPEADRVFPIPPVLVQRARIALVLTGVTVAVSVIGGVFGGVIVALHRFDYLNGVEVVVLMGRTATIVYALDHGGGLVSLSVI